ncbi:MAG: glycine zipper 2TM domain-containing protein [Rhodospirillales bacterium]|nr:MAG: glycine zipper 2TM domain-containing protein [Rhodospirillales bacterium]
MTLRSVIPLALAALLLAGCDTTGGTKQTIGTAGGAALGGLLGAQFGTGTGQLAATAAGTLIGALVGGEIGRSMDRTDQLYAARTAQSALETNPTGRTATWRNPDTGASGSFTPVSTSYTAAGLPCRDFNSTVVIDGQQERVTGRACRQADGSWQVVS